MGVADESIVVPVDEQANKFQGIVALSDAAAFVLRQLEEPKAEEELVELLIGEYSVDRATAEADLRKFLPELRTMGLIED